MQMIVVQQPLQAEEKEEEKSLTLFDRSLS